MDEELRLQLVVKAGRKNITRGINFFFNRSIGKSPPGNIRNGPGKDANQISAIFSKTLAAMKRKVLLLLLHFFSITLLAQTAYHLHEKVKVKWGGNWWDAEIVAIKNDQYRIHYDNYGNNWDEWVKTDRIQPKAAQNSKSSTNKPTTGAGGKFSIGEQIEAWSAGAWYPASIVSIGTDNYKGYYYVHFTGFSDASNQWLNASSVRKPQAKTSTADVSPRSGKYKILSYGNPANPIYLGYFTLSGSNYSYYSAANKLLGTGSYTYDKASRSVHWNSGPFNTNQWGGTFEISREGKTHTIRLKGVTIGTNSTDAQ